MWMVLHNQSQTTQLSKCQVANLSTCKSWTVCYQASASQILSRVDNASASLDMFPLYAAPLRAVASVVAMGTFHCNVKSFFFFFFFGKSSLQTFNSLAEEVDARIRIWRTGSWHEANLHHLHPKCFLSLRADGARTLISPQWSIVANSSHLYEVSMLTVSLIRTEKNETLRSCWLRGLALLMNEEPHTSCVTHHAY